MGPILEMKQHIVLHMLSIADDFLFHGRGKAELVERIIKICTISLERLDVRVWIGCKDGIWQAAE